MNIWESVWYFWQWQNTVFTLSYFVANFSSLFEIEKPMFLSPPVTIVRNCHSLNLEIILRNCLAVCTHIHFGHLSIYAVNFRICKICYRQIVPCQQLRKYHELCICNLFLSLLWLLILLLCLLQSLVGHILLHIWWTPC